MKTNRLLAELIAEAFGTFVLVLIGTGVVAMVVLFGKGVPGEIVNGGFTNITFAWGLGVTLAIYLTAKISGAHLNPAVTLTLAAFRGFPWSKVVPYSLAQILGGFCGAALTYLNYRPAFFKFDPDLSHTAGVFSTFPAFPDVPMAGFFDQVVGTAILLLVIFALSDERNMPPGAMHGYAINPARDLGPRLFTVVAGFRNNGLTDNSNTFVVPIVGPLVGGLLGGAAYDLCIRRFLPSSE